MSTLVASNLQASGGTGTVALLASVNGGPLSGTRNRIINGSFDVWQRGTSFADMTSPTTYTADRWSCFRGAYTAGISVTQVSGVSQNGISRNALRLQRVSGNTSTSQLTAAQSLESVNCRDLAGQSVTLSFWARRGANFSASSNVLVASIITTTGTNEVVRGTLTGAVTTPINCTLTESFQRFTSTVAVPSNASQIHVSFVYTPTGTAGVADSVDIMDVQLEPGAIATPFEHRSYGQELVLCQRYYCKTFPVGTAPAQNAGTASAIAFVAQTTTASTDIVWRFPVELRASPTTVTTYSPNAASANWSTNTDTPTASILYSGSAGLAVRASAAGAVGRGYSINISAEAEL